LSTWIIAGGLFALMAWIVIRAVRKIRRGGCAGGCAGCPYESKEHPCGKNV